MQRHNRLIAAKAHSLRHAQGLCESDSGDVSAFPATVPVLGVTSSRDKSSDESWDEDFSAFFGTPWVTR